MAELRIPITDTENAEIERWRKKLDKTRRTLVREALTDYIIKCKNAERGLEPVYVRSRHTKQEKFDLD